MGNSPEKRVVVARFGAAHGLRGEIRMKAFTTEASSIAAYGPLEADDGRLFEIEAARPIGGDMLVASIKGVGDRSSAEALSGLDLSVPRNRLPAPEEDDFYHADLIGLAAVTGDGAVLGRVTAIHNHGAGDIVEIERVGEPTLLVPFTRAAVPAIDIAGGRMTVVPPVETDDDESASP